jgi:hypothetical protein
MAKCPLQPKKDCPIENCHFYIELEDECALVFTANSLVRIEKLLQRFYHEFKNPSIQITK